MRLCETPGAVWGCRLPREVQLDFVTWSSAVRQRLSRNLNVSAMQGSKGSVLQITAGQGLSDDLRCCNTVLRVLGGLSEFCTSVLEAGSHCCVPEKMDKEQSPLSCQDSFSQVWLGQQHSCSWEVQTADTHWTPTFRECCEASRNADHRLGIRCYHSSLCKLMLHLFCEKDFFPEASEHLRIQKYLGFWVNWVWLVNGAERSNFFWWFGFKIHFMLKSPNILLLSLLLSQYYRILYFSWKMKKVCLPVQGWVDWFLFLWSHWHCIQSDFMNGEVFLLGNKFMGKSGSFKKHVPGALNIVWRRTADLKESLKQFFVGASVDNFTRWGREIYRKQFPYCFWFVACFLLGKQCWCL